MAKKATPKETNEVKDKDQLLEGVLKSIEKEYGKGAVMKLGDRVGVDVEPIPSGSLLLDRALGIGGYPKGRIIEIYGPESSGKTTLALHAIAEVQKRGGRAAFIDAENAIDPVYAKHLGVDIDELILSQPDSGEQGLNIMLMLIESGAVDLVVVDSVAALVPQVELDGEMGDMQVGVQARMMSKAMRKLSGIMNQNECTAIFINQLRLKVGVMYGNPETTPGGYALKFYSSVRIDIRKSEPIKDGTQIVGNKVNVKVVKNKVAPPFRTCQLEITYGKGLNMLSELLDLAVDNGIVKKAGSFYSYKGNRIGQGKEAAKEFLRANEEICKEVEAEVQAIISGSSLSEEIEAEDQAKSKKTRKKSTKTQEVETSLEESFDENDSDFLELENIDLETGEVLDNPEDVMNVE